MSMESSAPSFVWYPLMAGPTLGRISSAELEMWGSAGTVVACGWSVVG